MHFTEPGSCLQVSPRCYNYTYLCYGNFEPYLIIVIDCKHDFLKQQIYKHYDRTCFYGLGIVSNIFISLQKLLEKDFSEN